MIIHFIFVVPRASPRCTHNEGLIRVKRLSLNHPALNLLKYGSDLLCNEN